MNTPDSEMAIEKLTLNEEIYVDLLRHFDFLRAYEFSITGLNVYGRDHYLVYSSHRKELFIKWGDGFEVEISTGGLLRVKRVDVSSFAKQHGILLDTGYLFERIDNYAVFIKKHADELLR